MDGLTPNKRTGMMQKIRSAYRSSETGGYAAGSRQAPDGGSNEPKKDDREYLGEITGVKLVHELMVDIMGGLIPGVLFLFSLLVCVVFPIFCYVGLPYAPAENSYGQGWFWVVIFLTFLILSYVIGHIFYRSDIKNPDKADLKQQQSKFLRRFVRELKRVTDAGSRARSDEQTTELKIRTVARMLATEIEYLHSTLKSAMDSGLNVGDSSVYGEQFLKACTEAEDYLEAVVTKSPNRNERFYDKHLLCILFPEEADRFGCCKADQCALDLLPPRSRIVVEEYEMLLAALEGTRSIRFFGRRKKPEGSLLLSLAVCYNVLFMQAEVGCSTENRCDFPYISYYKYLLKRRETELLKYVDWNTTNARTKNKVNRYKIEIQMFASKAYSILNKNESHIRMAASSWYVARTMLRVAKWMMIITIVPIVYRFCVNFVCNGYAESGQYLSSSGPEMQQLVIAFCFPLGILILLYFTIKRRIVTFIHYQRLREIYHTLFIYHQWKSNLEVVSDREKLLKLKVEKERLDLEHVRSETRQQEMDSQPV
jgi:hypothetical protein